MDFIFLASFKVKNGDKKWASVKRSCIYAILKPLRKRLLN